jgi:hypothetical protein
MPNNDRRIGEALERVDLRVYLMTLSILEE